MNKHIHKISVLAFAISMFSTPMLAAAASTINVIDPAELVADGAGVLLSFEITCDPSFGPGSHMFGSAQLVQRSGNKVNSAYNFTSSDALNCDGTPQVFQILMTGSGKIFHKGLAAVQVQTYINDPSFSMSESAQVTEEIQIVK
ncbi:hypothetical protein [Nitrosomonas communis]|uniref:Uncharacterized protein n=1 Tax=Nitrosomonas communis TaxID=44574 RepID=A0A1I4RK46_9PROT|nr:hypothetical protein [Nitrosomonas communis]SFM52554.1 hypothetical protein SAMN05421863_103333 [Nitrosomonas communis]